MNKVIKLVLLYTFSIIGCTSMQAENYYVESNGIGPIKLGTNVKTLPIQVENLYDDLTIEMYADGFVEHRIANCEPLDCTFALNGETKIRAMAKPSGEIFWISIMTSDFKTKSGAYSGMPIQDFLKLQNTKILYNPDTYLYAKYEFKIDNIIVKFPFWYLTDSGYDKLNNATKNGATPILESSDMQEPLIINNLEIPEYIFDYD